MCHVIDTPQVRSLADQLQSEHAKRVDADARADAVARRATDKTARADARARDVERAARSRVARAVGREDELVQVR